MVAALGLGATADIFPPEPLTRTSTWRSWRCTSTSCAAWQRRSGSEGRRRAHPPLHEGIRARPVREREISARGYDYAIRRDALLEKAERSRKGGYSLIDRMR